MPPPEPSSALFAEKTQFSEWEYTELSDKIIAPPKSALFNSKLQFLELLNIELSNIPIAPPQYLAELLMKWQFVS